MTTAKSRTNTPTEQNKEDNQLVLYRLQLVEDAVKSLGTKLDKQDNIKKADLNEFKDVIISRITDLKVDFQRQIDEKADKSELSDLKKLVYSFGAFLSTLVSGAFLYLLTKGH